MTIEERITTITEVIQNSYKSADISYSPQGNQYLILVNVGFFMEVIPISATFINNHDPYLIACKVCEILVEVAKIKKYFQKAEIQEEYIKALRNIGLEGGDI